MEKLIEKIKVNCPICNKEHFVEKRKRTNKIKIKDKVIEYEEIYLQCPQTNEEENEYVNAEIMDENLQNARDAYRFQNNLLTSKEIKQIRNKYKITQLEMAKLLGVGDITVTRYETKQIQDEAHDKIMRLIDENALIALEYLEKNKEKFQKEERYETIENNIKIGKKDATDEEVIAAARLANCEEFVERMPDKWNSMIGENGSELSGGERQRISIARAFLKDAPIILLDEATASLDVDNESLIQQSISKLIENKTVLIIAHRMRTVAGVDKIVVLKDGETAEMGSPAQLMKKGGIYKHMCETQLKSEKWNYFE